MTHKDLATRAVSKAYEILAMLDHVDGGDWLGESMFAADLDKLAQELGYESAMDVPNQEDERPSEFVPEWTLF